jgi:phospholipid/cholesterol/gamma-HCH transport system permease protein
MATVSDPRTNRFGQLLDPLSRGIEALGDLGIFAGRVFRWVVRPPRRGTLVPVFYSIGVQSIPVVAVTGMFIGMVLAVQAYSQFYAIGMATRLGQIVNISVVRELGPVLAAVMLAGRVGGAMAAELATMRVTEQIDALACLGANPVQHLAVPRFLACVLLIPALTVFANFMGILGGALVSIRVFHIDGFHYWANARGQISLWDLTTGLIKPTFFGAAIAIISCQRGFESEAGAEGVGKAATSAFVASFIAILALDFFLGLFLNNLHDYLWPTGAARIVSKE